MPNTLLFNLDNQRISVFCMASNQVCLHNSQPSSSRFVHMFQLLLPSVSHSCFSHRTDCYDCFQAASHYPEEYWQQFHSPSASSRDSASTSLLTRLTQSINGRYSKQNTQWSNTNLEKNVIAIGLGWRLIFMCMCVITASQPRFWLQTSVWRSQSHSLTVVLQ